MAQVEGLNLKMPGDLGSELALSRGPVMDPFATNFDGTDDRVSTTYATRQNLVTNPRGGALATTGWSTSAGVVNAGATITAVNDWRDTAFNVSTTGAAVEQGAYIPFNLTSGTSVQARIRLKRTAGTGTIYARVVRNSSPWTTHVIVAASTQTEFSELTLDFTPNFTGEWVLIVGVNEASATTFRFTECLVGTAGTYFDGAGFENPEGFYQASIGQSGWRGTAHASISDLGCFANGVSRTWMGWAYRDTSGTDDALFGGSINGIDGIVCQLASGGNNVQFSPLQSGGVTTWTGAWPGNGQWVHWAVVFNEPANLVSLYINGALVSTETQSLPFVTGSTLEVGSSAGASVFDGKMQGFAAYEQALTATQIANAASASDYETVIRSFGPAIILPLNSKGGLTDASGNGRNGTAVGGVTVGAYSPGPLDTGTKWSLYELDLGNPSKREEMISSTDSDGSVPARVQKLENREVTFSVQLGDASSQDDAVAKIGALEAYLLNAEQVSSQTVIDPANYVRLVYTPADSTQSFFLPIMFAEITSVPKTVEDGWFVNFPKVSVRCVCDPAGYGALRTYLDTTTSAAPAPSVTVAGGPGDLSPWVRTAVKDVAATARGLVRLSVKRGESSTTATVLASAMTAVAGTYSAPNMTTSSTSTDWSVLATTPRQTRTGSFRVYAHRVSQPGGGTPSLRLTWGEAGGSVRHNSTVTEIDTSLRDVYLGEVTANTSWDMWLESKGGVSLYSLILVPSDSFVETTTAAPGKQMVGAVVAQDNLLSTSTHIGGRTLTSGGTWSTTNSISPTWPVSAANWARRSALSMGSPAFAQAGTTNYMDHQVGVMIRPGVPTAVDADGIGLFARFVDTSNYLRLIWQYSSLRFRLEAVVGGTSTVIWQSAAYFPLLSTDLLPMALQVTSDGRFFVTVRHLSSGFAEKAVEKYAGSHPHLVSGAALGNASASKVGLYDYWTSGTGGDRDWSLFYVSPLTGVTPAPIPSGSTIRLAGADMYGTDSQDYPYIGSSGLTLSPGVNNNLTVMAQRSAVGHASTSTADTPALDLDIDGYPRYLSVPHA